MKVFLHIQPSKKILFQWITVRKGKEALLLHRENNLPQICSKEDGKLNFQILENNMRIKEWKEETR